MRPSTCVSEKHLWASSLLSVMRIHSAGCPGLSQRAPESRSLQSHPHHPVATPVSFLSPSFEVRSIACPHCRHPPVAWKSSWTLPRVGRRGEDVREVHFLAAALPPGHLLWKSEIQRTSSLQPAIEQTQDRGCLPGILELGLFPTQAETKGDRVAGQEGDSQV